MTPAEALTILAAVAERSWNGRLDQHASADEVARVTVTTIGVNAQGMGAKLAVLERAGLVERKREDWGSLWRCSSNVRELLERFTPH